MPLKISTLFLPCLLILASSASFSGTMGTEQIKQTYDNFYVGADIGLSDLQDKTNHTVSPETHYLGGIGIVGGGLIGYDISMTPRLKMGIEGFGNAAGLNTSIQHYNQTTGIQDTSEKISSRYNAGVRVLPGYFFTPYNEGHLIIGYSNGGFKHTDNGTYGYLDTSFHKNGIQGGAGWKTILLNQHTILRLDVIYTGYASQSSTGLGLSGSGSTYQYYNDNLSTLEADLSLIYKF